MMTARSETVDYTKSRWIKFFTNEPPDQMAWEAGTRSLRDHLLRYPCDDDGVLSKGCSDPVGTIISMVRAAPRERRFYIRHTNVLLLDGFLTLDDDGTLRIKNYQRAQTTVSRETQRKRDARVKPSKTLAPNSDNAGHGPDSGADMSESRPGQQSDNDWDNAALDREIRERERLERSAGAETGLQTKSRDWLDALAKGRSGTFEMNQGANPINWPELKQVAKAFQNVWRRNDQPRTSRDSRCVAVVERFADGYTPADLQAAFEGSKLDPHIAENKQYQTIKTILRDAAQVDKFRSLLAPNVSDAVATRENPPAPPEGVDRWVSNAFERGCWLLRDNSGNSYTAKPGETARLTRNAKARERPPKAS